MKYDPIKNPNYVATVIEVVSLVDLEGLDNLKAINLFGMQALVSKDTALGTIGVLFSTEVQLSEEFAKHNNLHRHSNLNIDPTQQGYLEDSRRVKAIKLRGHRSDSLFVSLDAFSYLGVKPSDFKVGDVFDAINGHEIVRKYQIKEPGESKGPQAKVRRVDVKSFPLHIDSENYWRNSFKIPEDAPIVVTQKLHGTSVRYGKVPVANDLNAAERIMKWLWPKKFKETTAYKFVVGSRMVVKSIDFEAESAGKEHFYASDLWSTWAQEHSLDKLLPDGFIIYGELVGFTPDGAPIQKGYTYEQAEGTADLYVYRVAYALGNGQTIDLSWPQVKSFAHGIGLKTVPELNTYLHDEFVADEWTDKVYYNEWVEYGDKTFKDAPVRLSDVKSVDEGVCVRYDGPNGIYILKAKSPIFLGYESKLLDEGVVDTESEESA